jgi:hypothetical protein
VRSGRPPWRPDRRAALVRLAAALPALALPWIAAAPAARGQASAEEPAYRFRDRFEGALRPEWIPYGVRGDGHIARSGSGYALRMEAGGKIGEEVGKACIVHAFPTPLLPGDRLEVAALFRLPAIADGRISLIDIECKQCGVATQPGIRLFLDLDRRIYLERGKLGHSGSFWQDAGDGLPVDDWCELRWLVRFGHGSDGLCRIWLDGRPILEARGANFPDQAVADGFSVQLAAEQYDRVQIGITANSQPEPTALDLRDVRLTVYPSVANSRLWST